jgi:hypothetical protein
LTVISPPERRKVQSQANRVLRMVLVPTGVVLVLVIRIEFNVPTYRQKETGIEGRGAPLVVLALVIGLNGAIRDKVVGVR